MRLLGSLVLSILVIAGPTPAEGGIECGLVPVDPGNVIERDSFFVRVFRSNLDIARKCMGVRDESASECFSGGDPGRNHGSVPLLDQLFGLDFDGVLASESGLRSRCQRTIAKRAMRVAARQIRADASCRKVGVTDGSLEVCWDKRDCVAVTGNARLVKARARLKSRSDFCAAKFNLRGLFPGDCLEIDEANEVGFGDCLGNLAQCRVCSVLTIGCYLNCWNTASCETGQFGSTSTITCTTTITTTTTTMPPGG